MGVAFGEAGSSPITHSLISDYFPFKRRAMAMAMWAMSLPIGVMLGFALGGWFSTILGWRHAFVAVGLAGLALLPLVHFVLREPQRGQFDSGPLTAKPAVPPLKEIAGIMWGSRAYRLMLSAIALHLTTLFSQLVWLPQFFARVHQLPVVQVGLVMALGSGVGGMLGNVLSGLSSNYLARKDVRWLAWLPAISSAVLVPMALLQFWAESLDTAIALGVVNGCLLQSFVAPSVTATQSVMPAHIRSFTGAFHLFFINLIAMSIGPVATGVLSDAFGASPDILNNALRYALSILLLGTLLSVPLFVTAARTLPAELRRSAGVVGGPQGGA
jgi:predicted MFS family arabinose efflux permease